MKATTDYLTAGSRYFRSGLHRFFRIQNNDPSLVGRGQQHALALQAAQLGCFQIRHDDDLFANEILGSVMVPDAGADLSLLRTEIDLQNHQPIRIGMRLGGFYRGDFEFDFAKVFNGDHGVVQFGRR